MDSEILGLIVKELNKNGVNLIKHDFSNIDTFSPENVDYFRPGELPQIFDFSEHDKVFDDKIAKLVKENAKVYQENMHLEEQCVKKEDEIYKLKIENQELKQRIAELESKKTEKPTKINLNDRVKVKLTPLGAEIYYHQYDELNKQIKERGGKQLEPRMPEIDKDGYTKFTLWNFMELYGEHMGMCKPNVIAPLYIELCQDEWKMRYNEEPIEKVKE